MAAVGGRLRLMTTPKTTLEAVRLMDPPLPRADELGRLIGGPACFNQDEDALVFPRSIWEAETKFAAPDVSDAVLQLTLPIARAAETNGTLLGEVTRAMREALEMGIAVTLASVAKRFHMAARTLQRRLSESGTSFEELRDDLRRRVALEYVRSRELSLMQIADVLGFGEVSALSRAFRRWTGVSPREYRRRAALSSGS